MSKIEDAIRALPIYMREKYGVYDGKLEWISDGLGTHWRVYPHGRWEYDLHDAVMRVVGKWNGKNNA